MPRELWKGAIQFGLVHVPVSPYPAEQPRRPRTRRKTTRAASHRKAA
jgi:non-homologous end joining protein Ku